MRVHFIGVAGTGMGALATLFREAGHDVTGSDAAFDPPIGPALEAAGITCLRGYDAAHLDARPDLVVVGNVIRRDNPEATRVREMGLPARSMSGALREHFLAGRRPLVVAGTHGKTTTSAMCAFILASVGLEPGYFIGGLPKDFPSGAAIGATRRRLALAGASGAPPGGAAPFVVEGDEYDAVYWHKAPKFLDYVGVGRDDVAIVTSLEHDHIDIYPDGASYERAFADFARALPEGGIVVCDASQRDAARVVRDEARARKVFYALQGDETGDDVVTWLGAPATVDPNGAQTFDLYAGGVFAGRFSLASPGRHNVRNAVAALAACAEGFGAPLVEARRAIASFQGVKRRQDLLGSPGGVRVYDDFAHHPSAVAETLAALRARHPGGALWAVFEPRSATACRSLHQTAYATAFGAADRVILAPLGRSTIAEGERLDLPRLARDIGGKAEVAAGVDAIIGRIADGARSGDTVAILSNGSFGGIHARLVAALAERAS